MNSPNYPPPGGQGPYGQPQGQPQGQPYGQRPPQPPQGGQPFGGQPPQGQSYGGPPPQGQPFGGGGGFGAGGPGGPSGPGGAPPASYPTPPPPPPSAKPKNTGTIIKIVVGVLVIAVGAVVYFVTKGSSPASSAVGDCIKVNEASISNADVDKVDCTDPAATYKVGATFDDAAKDCPGGDDANYVGYTETGRGSDLLLCLILNAKEGDCFEQGSQVDTKVDCGSPKATFQVTKVLKDSVDEAGCPEGTQGVYKYPEPKPGMVQCLTAPGGGTTTG